MNRRWRLLRVAAVTATLALASVAGEADQTAPELPGLFSELGDAPNRAAAHAIEQRIWQHWFAAPGTTAEQELRRARELAERGDAEQALATFDGLVERHPDYAEGWNQRAIMRFLIGDVGGALADVDRVLSLEPRHFGALSGRGQCYLRMERYREALDAFEAALSINPWIESAARQVEMLRALIQQQRPI